jgi:hypothetical protein
MESLAETFSHAVQAVEPLILEEVSAAFSRTFSTEDPPKRNHKKMSTSTSTTPPAPSSPRLLSKDPEAKLKYALAMFQQIANLPENSKLRSWRGREATRLAAEAYKELATK